MKQLFSIRQFFLSLTFFLFCASSFSEQSTLLKKSSQPVDTFHSAAAPFFIKNQKNSITPPSNILDPVQNDFVEEFAETDSSIEEPLLTDATTISDEDEIVHIQDDSSPSPPNNEDDILTHESDSEEEILVVEEKNPIVEQEIFVTEDNDMQIEDESTDAVAAVGGFKSNDIKEIEEILDGLDHVILQDYLVVEPPQQDPLTEYFTDIGNNRWLQVGAFRDSKNALNSILELKSHGFDVRVTRKIGVTKSGDNIDLFAVIIRDNDTRARDALKATRLLLKYKDSF
ncbi:MAG: SPOR domain-containing protein, partial [Treponemataceae bacterium]